MSTARIYVSRLVAKSLKKNQKISIVPTKKSPVFSFERKEYTNFDKIINNTIDEISNDVLGQIQACAWDYPDHYINIITISPEGHEVIHVIQEPKDFD